MAITLKRAYEKATDDDGKRILVDRLWPRGVSKERAKLDGWLKDVAPSTELRKWFGHDPDRWAEFQKRYRAELRGNAALAELKGIVKQGGRVTLIYGACDELHNEAVVLKRILDRVG